MGRVLSALCAATVVWAVLPGQAWAETDAERCDALAASSHDLDLPPGSTGVSFSDLEPTDEAFAACRAALEAAPHERRFLTHLGRLHVARGEYRKAIDSYRYANGRGSAVAAHNLGAMYQSGWGVPQNEMRATQYYRKAAGRGMAFSMQTLAARAREGYGMRKNLRLAAFWYERASEEGDALSTHDLGVMYRDGIGVREDDAKAFDLMVHALELDPDYALAAYNLGTAYETGEGVEVDLEQARLHYALSAENGDGDGAGEVGRFFAEGIGVEVDPVAAAEWYARGTAQGSMASTVSLADAYQDGLGVAESSAEALRLYNEALTLNPNDEWRAYIVDRISTVPVDATTD